MVAAPAPRWSRLEADERRAQILAAARAEFARDGLAGASMAGIARSAGVARGLVNHYFGGKRELYLAVVADLAGELGTVAHTSEPDLPIAELVERNAAAWLDSVERNRELWRALFGVEAIGTDPEVEAILDAARESVIERMAANHGAPLTDEVRLVLRIYLGAAEAGAREWALRGRATREQVHAVLVGTLLAMVGGVLPRLPGR